MYATIKSETLINKVKLILAHCAFGAPLPQLTTTFDENKPLLVPCAADSFESIGASSLDSVKRSFIAAFPQVATKVVIPDNPSKDPNFAERDIDLVRAHKEKVNDSAKVRKRYRSKQAKQFAAARITQQVCAVSTTKPIARVNNFPIRFHLFYHYSITLARQELDEYRRQLELRHNISLP